MSHHLVVLCHGMLGYSTDLTYLGKQLEDLQFIVLYSTVNEGSLSLDGVVECAERLVQEIRGVIAQNTQLKEISLIGNSFGGLLVRYAAKILLDPKINDGKRLMNGLVPNKLLTVSIIDVYHLDIDNL